MSLCVADPIATPCETALRRAMIDSQLRPNGVINPSLLTAMELISRTAHIPANDAALAYSDRAVPLTSARALNPTLTTARLIDDAQIAAGHNVLLIGAATGYAAALLAGMGARVTAVESDPALLVMAREALSDTAHVTLTEAPLTAGAPDSAPYDVLIIDGAVESVPEALVAQLSGGARIAAGMADAGVTRLARAIKIEGSDAVNPIAFADLECVRLPGFSPPSQFTF